MHYYCLEVGGREGRLDVLIITDKLIRKLTIIVRARSWRYFGGWKDDCCSIFASSKLQNWPPFPFHPSIAARTSVWLLDYKNNKIILVFDINCIHLARILYYSGANAELFKKILTLFQSYILPILHSSDFTLPILHTSNPTLFQSYTLPIILHSLNLTLLTH